MTLFSKLTLSMCASDISALINTTNTDKNSAKALFGPIKSSFDDLKF